MNEEQLQEHLVSGQVLGYGRSPAPLIVCADGLTLSVQASKTHYCNPRNDEGPYSTVEIGFTSEKVEEFMEYAEDAEDPTGTVYGQVPVKVVLRVINSRGGVVLG